MIAGPSVASAALSGLTADCQVDPSGVTRLQHLIDLLMWFRSRPTCDVDPWDTA